MICGECHLDKEVCAGLPAPLDCLLSELQVACILFLLLSGTLGDLQGTSTRAWLMARSFAASATWTKR